MDWLDTETKALLQGSPPEKLAPPDTEAFTLVLLATRGTNPIALLRSVQRAALVSADEAERILSRPLPTPVKQAITYLDAQIAQFELICCDAISVILPDRVVQGAAPEYLKDLYAKLLKIDEFEPVLVHIDFIRANPSGEEFCDRFLGGQRLLPAIFEVMRKKARIMQHWAEKLGGRVTLLQKPSNP
jgi:hypothetical protein